MHRSLHLLLMLVAFVVATRAFAGDKDNATPANNTSAVVKTTVPEIRIIAYYSSKAAAMSPLAQRRHGVAKRAIDHVKQSPKDGGFGVPAGFRDVEDMNSWKDFIRNCQEGEEEATSYLPLIRRGGVVIVITDRDEKQWVYGPAVLNDAMEGFQQVSLMKNENERLNPARCGLSITAQSKPTAVIASTTASRAQTPR